MVPNPRGQQSPQAVLADQTDSRDRFLTAEEAAESLGGINPATLVRRAREGQVPAYPLEEGKRRLWRFRSADLRNANGYGAALITDREAADRLGLSAATLRSWRCRGIGPAFIKMGSGSKAPVRYSEADLEQFIAQSRRVPSVRAAFEG